jgi:hypothetical protein
VRFERAKKILDIGTIFSLPVVSIKLGAHPQRQFRQIDRRRFLGFLVEEDRLQLRERGSQFGNLRTALSERRLEFGGRGVDRMPGGFGKQREDEPFVVLMDRRADALVDLVPREPRPRFTPPPPRGAEKLCG